MYLLILYGVSGADINLNEFTMGQTHELAGDEDQMGISFTGYMAKFSIQENKFIRHGDNADFMLGIRAENLGEMNNEIRKNIFDGISVGNESFSNCADITPEAHRGLHYLCNENTDVQIHDFYLPQTDFPDYIRDWQCLTTQTANAASGNTFSLSSGDPTDGDFANYSDWGYDEILEEWRLKYFYDNNIALETPMDYFGIEIIPSVEKSCLFSYCPHPCLEGEGFELEKADFYDNSDNYKIAYTNDDFQLAAYYRNQIDSNIYHILGYLEFDTSSISRDTLRAWYKRSLTLAGDLMLAGDYTYTEEYSRAIETLDSMPIRHAITPGQQFDINRLKTAYGFLATKSVFNLSSSEIDSLHLYSQGYGASYTASRAILAVLDSVYTPRYYVPGEINPRSKKEAKEIDNIHSEIKVYPNPASEVLYIEVGNQKIDRIELIDALGRIIWTTNLEAGMNELNLEISGVNPGIFNYRIYAAENLITSGLLIISR